MENRSPKSIHLEDDIHLKLNEIQFDLKKVGIEKSLKYICDISIRVGINNTLKFVKDSENSVIDEGE